MAKNMVVWEGLEELRTAMRNLPKDLTVEASRLVEGAANGAAVDIRGAYPVRTGKLRDSVTVKAAMKGEFVTAFIVKNSAKHAALFEKGTQARHTALGANRGSMPPGRVFVPRVIRARRALTDQLKDLLTRHGAKVSGA